MASEAATLAELIDSVAATAQPTPPSTLTPPLGASTAAPQPPPHNTASQPATSDDPAATAAAEAPTKEEPADGEGGGAVGLEQLCAAVGAEGASSEVVSVILEVAGQSLQHAGAAAATSALLFAPEAAPLLKSSAHPDAAEAPELLLSLCEVLLMDAARGSASLSPHHAWFIGSLHRHGILGHGVLQHGVESLLSLDHDQFEGDVESWRSAWTDNVTAALTLIDAGGALPIETACTVLGLTQRVGLGESELTHALEALAEAESPEATRSRADQLNEVLGRATQFKSEGWDEWGPAGLNVPGCPVGRCPLCRKKVFIPRSVVPASGWERTLDHMTYQCCYGLVNAFSKHGECPVEHCGMQADSKKTIWQVAAHLDGATDHDHVAFLDAYRGDDGLRGGVKDRKTVKIKAPKLLEAQQNAKKIYGLCKGNKVQEVKAMLRAGNVDLLRGGEDGYTPLMTAAEAGHVKVVKTLMRWALHASTEDREAQGIRTPPDHDLIGLNAKNTYGQTALILAAQNHADPAMVRQLCTAGEDLDVTVRANGLTAESVARMNKYTVTADAIAAFTERYAAVARDMDALDDAISAEDPAAVAKILNAGHVFESKWWGAEYGRRGYGEAPLAIAASRGCLAIVKLLVQCRVPPSLNATNAHGHSAVLKAARNEHAEVVEFLATECKDVNLGGVVDTLDEAGLHALARTVQAHTFSRFQHAIDKRVNQPDRQLHYAIREGNLDKVVELADAHPALLSMGWPHRVSPNPVQTAAIYNQPEIARALAERTPTEVLLWRVSGAKRTALEEAAHWGHDEVVAALTQVASSRSRAATNAPARCGGSTQRRGVPTTSLAAIRKRITAMAAELEAELAVLEGGLDAASARECLPGRSVSGIPSLSTAATSVAGATWPRFAAAASNAAAPGVDQGDQSEGEYAARRIVSAPVMVTGGSVMAEEADRVARHKSGAPMDFLAAAEDAEIEVSRIASWGSDDGDVRDVGEYDVVPMLGVRGRGGSDKHRPPQARRRYKGEAAQSLGGALEDVNPNKVGAGAGAALQRAFLAAHKRSLAQQWAVHAETTHGYEKTWNYGGTQKGWGAAPKIPIAIEPLHLHHGPVSRFLSRQRALGGRVRTRPAWHGTPLKNFASIEEHGLLVPGGHGDVWAGKPYIPVANGQVHGKGVYTAKGPSLAHGYSRNWNPKEDMLICAVLDDKGKAEEGQGSRAVKHVGDAMVVAKESHVLPLFKVRFGHDDEYERPKLKSTDGRDAAAASKAEQTQRHRAAAKQRDLDRRAGRSRHAQGIEEEFEWSPVVSEEALAKNNKLRKTRAKQAKQAREAARRAEEELLRATEALGHAPRSAAERRREQQVQLLLRQGLSGFGGGSRRNAANTEELLLKKLKKKQQGGRNRRSKPAKPKPA